VRDENAKILKQEINYPSIGGIPYRSLPLWLYDGFSKPLADLPILNAEWCELRQRWYDLTFVWGMLR